MADFILEVAEKGRRVSLHRGFVIISTDHEELGRVPLDTIEALVLSAEDCLISRASLARLAEENVPVIICGSNYMPVATCLPTSPHYRPLKVFHTQNNASPVIKKQIWQGLVMCKIHNQAEVLRQCRPGPVVEALKKLAENTRSGDVDNKEAQAARLYWPALLGEDFVRNTEKAGVNAWLNYGYTVVRAAFARAVCAAGLQPMLGVNHHNTYNAFCLVDDLMEPMRPFIDKIVYENRERVEEVLKPQDKKILTQVLRDTFPLSGEQCTLSHVATRMAQGLARSLEQKLVSMPFPQI